MELRDAPETSGLGDRTFVDISKEDPEWFYQEGDLRAIGKTAHILYTSTEPDEKYDVEQVT